MSKRPLGYIYRIYHEDIPNQCYVGKTELTIKRRLEGHIREAKKANIGDAKLHIVMKAHIPSTFKVEELAHANSLKELSALEDFYIKKFNSKKDGWNKVSAPKTSQRRGKKIIVKIEGKELESNSLASLCRELGVSNSTVNYWRVKRKKSLNFSIKQALKTKQETKSKKLITVFRKEFKDVAQLAKSKFNKQSLHPSTIRKRVENGCSYEEALTKKVVKPRPFEIKFEGRNLRFKNLSDAYRELSKKLKHIPTYSSVISSKSKGSTYEQAFGIDKPKWKSNFDWVFTLISEGYKLTGELNASSKPVIDEDNKEIFSSVKVFSETYGFDYTTISAEVKKGLKPSEIIKKRM